MNRAGLLAALILALAVSPAPGQTVVPVHQEPRHHLVHEGDGFRVLDVQIPSGDTTLYHTHDAPIAYVAIDISAVDSQPLGGDWRGTDASAAPAWRPGEVNWNLGYAAEALTHRVTTVGPGQFRLIGIINYGSGAFEHTASGVAARGEAEAESRWFRVSRLTLAPGQVVEWERSSRPAVAVLVSEGRAVAASNGTVTEASGRGAFLVHDISQKVELRNPGTAAVDLVCVEIR